MAKPGYVKFIDSVSLSIKPFAQEDAKRLQDFYAQAQNTGKALRVRVAATHSGKITRNNGFYLPHKMRAGARTFTDQYSKPVLIHHADENDPIGRVVQAKYIDISTGLKDSWNNKALKDSTRPLSDALLDAFCSGTLKDSEYLDIVDRYFIRDKAIVDDPDYQGLGYIELLADITNPDAIQKILDGRYLTGSVGATTNAAICSKCKQDWAKDSKCEHTPGQVYDGIKCVLVAGDLSYDEWSLVNKPADRHSRIIEVNVAGVQDHVELDSSILNPGIPEIVLIVDQDTMMLSGPGGEDGHQHSISIDENGNGTTSVTDKHKHTVVNFIVKEADNHTHDLPESISMMKEHKDNVQKQEDSIMLFRDAMEVVSKVDFLKDLETLPEAVKSVLENVTDTTLENELIKLVAEKLDKLSDYEKAYPAVADTAADVSIQDFFGVDVYNEIVGDDPWGQDYANMIYEASIADAELAAVLKDAKLTAKARKGLAGSTFCGPERSFPVPDCAHHTAAMRLLGRYKGPGDKERIRACIERKGKRMGCGSMMKEDSVPAVPSEYANMAWFDNFDDKELQDMASGLKQSLEDRGIECKECVELNDARILELEKQIEGLESKLATSVNQEDLKNKLDSARQQINFLHGDIDSLQNALADAQVSIRNQKASRIIDMKRLAGETVDTNTEIKDLEAKAAADLDVTLADYLCKVDILKIADNLNSGLANKNPEGVVQDPTVLDASNLKNKVVDTKKSVELTREVLEKISAQIAYLRMQKDGKRKVEQYITDCKRQGLIPDEYPVNN